MCIPLYLYTIEWRFGYPIAYRHIILPYQEDLSHMERSSSIRLYTQEVIDFLDNIVVKYEPFVHQLNRRSEYAYVAGFNEYDQSTYPYYRILAGDVSIALEPIYAYSPILRSEILLTNEVLQQYPDIRVFYSDHKNLKSLLSRHPKDHALIRRIINPVIDIESAIHAKNLTILPTVQNDIFLNEYERADIIYFLQQILWKIDYRWYNSPFE